MRARSASSTLRWPALVPPQAQTVHALWLQLMQSQGLTATALQTLQDKQLAARLVHAAQNSTYFAPSLKGMQIVPENAREVLARLPLLGRAELQTQAESIYCATGPWHGAVQEKRTTGSTGQPVVVRCTGAAFDLREAITLRNFAGFGMDVRQSFAAIRSGLAKGQPDGISRPGWGGVIGQLFATGPSHALDLATPAEQQIAWLEKHKPVYFLTYPSNLQLLISTGLRVWSGLQGILTVGENVSDELRQNVRACLRASVWDQYSCEEAGHLAAQCAAGQYHVASENVVLEVLREDGSTCLPGETGRVVVTDMRNFASALLRYELRDYAEVGSTCSCGRHSPVLRRMVGRTRQQIHLPDGRKVWPSTGLRNFVGIPLRQFQLVQLSVHRLELRVHTDRELTPQEKIRVVVTVQMALGHPFDIEVVNSLQALPLGPGGKFEQFVSLV